MTPRTILSHQPLPLFPVTFKLTPKASYPHHPFTLRATLSGFCVPSSSETTPATVSPMLLISPNPKDNHQPPSPVFSVVLGSADHSLFLPLASRPHLSCTSCSSGHSFRLLPFPFFLRAHSINNHFLASGCQLYPCPNLYSQAHDCPHDTLIGLSHRHLKLNYVLEGPCNLFPTHLILLLSPWLGESHSQSEMRSHFHFFL